MVDLPTWERYSELLGPLEGDGPYCRAGLLLFKHPVEDTAGVQKQMETIGQGMAKGSGSLLRMGFYRSRCLCVLLAGAPEAIGDESPLMVEFQALLRGSGRPEWQVFSACGGLVDTYQRLECSFYQCRRGAKDLFFRGWGGCSFWQRDELFQPLRFDVSLLSDYARALSRRDRPAAFEALEAVYQAAAANRSADPERVRGIYFALWCLVDTEFARWRETGRVPDGEEIKASETLEGLRGLLVRQTRLLLDPPAEEEVCPAVATVIRLMRENFSDKNLTVASLAEKVYLTPSYLSGLFRKNTGKTINQYLTKIRIEYSMNLLMDKQIKISRIAEMVGYSDSNYMTKAFKRHVGLTPTEYRAAYCCTHDAGSGKAPPYW